MNTRMGILALALLGSGCMLFERSLSDVPEGPISWRVGYADGCQSGRSTAREYGQHERDVRRYKTDDTYRHGWHEGYDVCFARQEQADQPTATVAPPSATPTTAPRPATPTPQLVPSPLAATKPGERRRQITDEIEQFQERIRKLQKELERLPQQ